MYSRFFYVRSVMISLLPLLHGRSRYSTKLLNAIINSTIETSHWDQSHAISISTFHDWLRWRWSLRQFLLDFNHIIACISLYLCCNPFLLRGSYLPFSRIRFSIQPALFSRDYIFNFPAYACTMVAYACTMGLSGITLKCLLGWRSIKLHFLVFSYSA